MSSQPVTDTRLELRSDPSEITHIVCCRDPEWKNTWCGADADHVNPAATDLCSMCIDVATQRLPSFLANEPTICPMDFERCPDEHEVDLRILREVSPD
ncbi:hypothetical protein [Knoellia sp. Soil729]|uniref:hypothetical protein n=1 Tax=Knoellia sp. Soil729 TaxID=1736394 RepID=UPI0012E94056|nr:hypothetical protein [Knoellia sp. Soil729]